MPGSVVMGTGPRVRWAYLVLSVASVRDGPGDALVWRLLVEPRSAARGRAEIAEGRVHHPIVWDGRGRKSG